MSMFRLSIRCEVTTVFRAKMRLCYRHVAGTLTRKNNGMESGVTLYPDQYKLRTGNGERTEYEAHTTSAGFKEKQGQGRLIFSYSFAKGGGITVYISVLNVEI